MERGQKWPKRSVLSSSSRDQAGGAPGLALRGGRAEGSDAKARLTPSLGLLFPGQGPRSSLPAGKPLHARPTWLNSPVAAPVIPRALRTLRGWSQELHCYSKPTLPSPLGCWAA